MAIDLSAIEAEQVESKLIEIWKSMPDPYRDIGMKAFIRSLGWAYKRMPDVRRHLDTPDQTLRDRLTQRLGKPVGNIFCTAKCLSLSKIPPRPGQTSEKESEAEIRDIVMELIKRGPR